MMAQGHFSLARQDFQDLKHSHIIPPKMKIKLDYLLANLLDQKPLIQSLGDQLPEYQRSSLETLDQETKQQIFINIMNCLSGRDVILYFKDQKAYLRKDQTFSMWNQCYLTLDSNEFTIHKKNAKKPSHEFKVNDLRISKKFKEYKGKVVMGLVYEKKINYLLGFNEESACARTHQILRNLIREKALFTKKKSKIKSEQQIKSNGSQEHVAQYMEENVDENQLRNALFEEITLAQITLNRDFNLLKNYENGRILINIRRPHKIKMITMIKNMNPQKVLESYLQMNEWNAEVDECLVKTKICENNYLVIIKFKRYSYFSWPRYAYAVATATVIDDKYYLVIRNAEEESSNDSKDMVKMIFNQVLEICFSEENKEMALLTLVSEVDHQGYSSFKDSQMMSLKFLTFFQSFPKFLESQQITQNSVYNYFNFSKKMRIKEKSSDKSEISKYRYSSSSVTEYDLPISESARSSAMSEQRMNDFKPANSALDVDLTLYMMKNDPNVVISEDLVHYIKNRKLHEKYYLHHIFDQNNYFQPERLEHEVSGKNDYFLKGSWTLNNKDQAVFTDVQLLNKQKGVFKMILKQLGSNLMSGKSIMNISLPVQLFGDDSILERIGGGFGYLPKYLIPAGQCKDIVEQAKLVTAFFAGIPALHLNSAKPFNPILGETFEFMVGGIPIYMEQICHHPPISAVYVKTDTFRFYGSFNSHAELGLNTVSGANLNPLYVEIFKTKTFYQVKLPEMQISGTVFGDRKYRSCGRGFIYEKTNNIWTQLSYGKDKKKVYPYKKGKMKEVQLIGGMYTVTKKFGEKFLNCEVKKKFEGVSPEDIVEKHCDIEGHWGTLLKFDDQIIRSRESPVPNKVQYPRYVLPSDCNFRPDIIYKKMQRLKEANQEKEILENIQRRDRKLRSGDIKPKK